MFKANLTVVILISLLMGSCKTDSPTGKETNVKKPEQEPVEVIMEDDKFQAPQGWTELKDSEKIILDIRYASPNNFVNEKMYPCGKCFLKEEAGQNLRKIIDRLYDLGYKTVLFDCYRPRPVQQMLWDKVPNPSYVTPPHRGSMHNRGLAVDIGLADPDGNQIDMGTEYDYFGKEAHHDYYGHDKDILNRRALLRQLMELNDFKGIRTEWWHYAYSKEQSELSDWVWECD